MPPGARRYDAVVVGSGPNGVAAAIELARAGWSVLLCEAAPVAAGGMRSAELTLPGFVHDVCSSVHPLAVSSPFFRAAPLADHGLEWIYSPACAAHPLDDGSAVVAVRSLDETAARLGADARAYQRLFGGIVRAWDRFVADLLAPPRLPRHPVTFARFGLLALQSAAALGRRRFRTVQARALFAGHAAHSILPLEKLGSAAFGLVIGGSAHAVGWPIPRGGSQRIADALASYLRSLGGEVRTGAAVRSLEELPPARAVLCDVSPRQLAALAGARFPEEYRRRLERFRYGPGVYKVDWALDGPIPWRAPECLRASTVHLGGSDAEIAESERAAWEGRVCERPFVLLVQSSLFDPTRAPAGKHTVWAYCHVPTGTTEPMTERIERQIERFAPGFAARILARSELSPAALERYNPNLVGGAVNGGAQDLAQLFLRPSRRLYRTPTPGLYLCSASTPPGGGVHGMCGYFAARSALHDRRRGVAPFRG
jgi:phytoene dehydrogenase-like protein